MTRIMQSPGGTSTFSVFGDGQNAQSEQPVPAAVAVVSAQTATAPPAGKLTSAFESLKVQAITTVSQLNGSSECEQILRDLLQSLASTGAQPRAVLTADDALDNLRAELKARGTHGIISIGRKFQSIDDTGNKQIDFDEFSKAMQELNIPGPDTHRLFRYFDSDCSGFLSYEELLVGLRGQLNPRRLDMVQRAFKVLDKTGDGQVTLDDLKGRYNGKMHPDVILGTKTEEQVLAEFMSVFEAQGAGTKGDGIISVDEFKKYYESVSASIDLDDYFELVIRNAWHISGGEGWCANTTCKRILVLHDDGSQSVHEIQDDFDVGKDQYLQKLKDQGVTGIKAIAAYGEPEDVPEGKGAEPRSPMPAFGSGTPTPSSAGFASANKRGWQQRSSIQFG